MSSAHHRCFSCYTDGDAPSRIDYIFTTGAPQQASTTLQHAQVGLSYSDHLGLKAVCRFDGRSTQADRQAELPLGSSTFLGPDTPFTCPNYALPCCSSVWSASQSGFCHVA